MQVNAGCDSSRGNLRKGLRDPFVSCLVLRGNLLTSWCNKNYPTVLRRKTKSICQSTSTSVTGAAATAVCMGTGNTISRFWQERKRSRQSQGRDTSLLCGFHHSHNRDFNKTKMPSLTRRHARWVSGWLTPLTVWKSHCDSAAWTRSFRWYTFIPETIVQADDAWWMRAAEHQQKGSPLCTYRCGGQMSNASMLHLNQTRGKCLIDGLAECRMWYKSAAAAQVYAHELVHRRCCCSESPDVCPPHPPKKGWFIEIKWEKQFCKLVTNKWLITKCKECNSI